MSHLTRTFATANFIMQTTQIIDVIIPALNEEGAIANVIGDIPDIVRDIVVVDNGSSDATMQVAREAGATVLSEEERGYGAACLKGISHLMAKSVRPDTVVFLDGDYSDYPEDLEQIVRPILTDDIDMVIGSRVTGTSQKGSLTVPQRFGNWLATFLLRLIYGYRFTDLGPFRAIRFDKLLQLNMTDRNYGWTVEMQIKAAKQKLACQEVPVKYRVRIGKSKVSGTVKGSLMAGYKILYLLFRHV